MKWRSEYGKRLDQQDSQRQLAQSRVRVKKFAWWPTEVQLTMVWLDWYWEGYSIYCNNNGPILYLTEKD